MLPEREGIDGSVGLLVVVYRRGRYSGARQAYCQDEQEWTRSSGLRSDLSERSILGSE